jgi:hypothetical protein
MSDPNLDIILPTNLTINYEDCGEATPTLPIIEWEPDGRSVEQAGFDDVPFSIVINL